MDNTEITDDSQQQETQKKVHPVEEKERIFPWRSIGVTRTTIKSKVTCYINAGKGFWY